MISILGMHRSGTSALAGALHKLGADLGPESSWLGPAADNPRGFFEFRPVVDLNRNILAAMGGTWSSPPALPAGWTEDARLTELRARAEQVSHEIPADMVVKDPRLSLVQPLWDEVGRVRPSVLCLRHPAAVAESLRARNEFRIDEGLFLWFRYNAAAVMNRPDALTVEYETLLTDPVPQLRRVVEHIEIEASAQTIEAAAGTVYRDMAHHAPAELPGTPIGVVCGLLYEQLRTEAEVESNDMLWTWSRLLTELPWPGPGDREIQRARREAAEATSRIARLVAEKRRSEERLERVESELRHALAAVDLVTMSGTADLLRSQESEQR